MSITDVRAAPPNVAVLPPPETADSTALAVSASTSPQRPQFAGLIPAQSLQSVGELVRQNPKETVGILRQWLSEPA